MSSSSVPSVAAIVLAYQPDDDIVRNVELLGEQAAHVYIVNNSPDAPSTELLARFTDDDGVTVLEQSGNVGVAVGFNAGMRAGLAEGYDFVWIFDQDSTVTVGMLSRMLAAHRALGPVAGVIAPALRSHATGRIYRRESGVGAADLDVVISSGSLFSRGLIERIGMHDEPLFIDYVDHDICLRARRYGFRNQKVFDAVLDHRFGDSVSATLLGRRVYLSNYSPLRQYYMARNRMILIKRFGFGRWFWEDLAFTSKAWAKVLLRENDRRVKVAAFFRGWLDGVRYPTR